MNWRWAIAFSNTVGFGFGTLGFVLHGMVAWAVVWGVASVGALVACIIYAVTHAPPKQLNVAAAQERAAMIATRERKALRGMLTDALRDIDDPQALPQRYEWAGDPDR